MRRSLLDRFPFSVRRRLRDVETRIYDLERSFDKIIASPLYVKGGPGAFNGQEGRRGLFRNLTQTIAFDAVIETGTFFGDTAGYMHEMTRLPVYTCEVNPHFYLVSKKRLEAFPEIRVRLSDSRQFLNSLPREVGSDATVFCYLDAHWYEDLPLCGEIEIIARTWSRFVIMIDDFQVPDDSGYIYDDYGKGKNLTLGTISKQIRLHHLDIYFPSLPSSEETSIKRGCVVLTNGELSRRARDLGSLRPVGVR